VSRGAPRRSDKMRLKSANRMMGCDLSRIRLPSCRPHGIPDHSIMPGQTGSRLSRGIGAGREKQTNGHDGPRHPQ